MRIVWWPRYSKSGASSRIRVFSIHEALLMLGVDSEVGSEDVEDTDFLIIQKLTDPRHLDNAKRTRGKIVYDFDDIDIFVHLPGITRFVTLFTTDTEGHKADSQGYWKGRQCEVIPDCIDYFPAGPKPASSGDYAIWFGCYLNYPSAKWMGDTFRRNKIPLRLFTEEGHLQSEGGEPWQYDTFLSKLMDANVAFLSHTYGDRNKSNNKMTTAITHGVPCIVSDTPEYANLLRGTGFEWAIVRNENELIGAWDRLQDPAIRQAYLDKLQPMIWQNYSAKVIAKILLGKLGVF